MNTMIKKIYTCHIMTDKCPETPKINLTESEIKAWQWLINQSLPGKWEAEVDTILDNICHKCILDRDNACDPCKVRHTRLDDLYVWLHYITDRKDKWLTRRSEKKRQEKAIEKCTCPNCGYVLKDLCREFS